MYDVEIVISDTQALKGTAPHKLTVKSLPIGGVEPFGSEYPVELMFGFTLKDGCKYPFDDNYEVERADVTIGGETKTYYDVKLVHKNGEYEFSGNLVLD